MEALQSRLTPGEQSGGHEHSQPGSPRRDPQPESPAQHCQAQETICQHDTHDTLQPQKAPPTQPPERKRLGHQRQRVDSDAAPEGKCADEAAKTTRVQSSSSGTPGPSAVPGSTPSKQGTPKATPKQKRERKPQRPGKYVCSYCGRACAKPSVLQKHIRSHTGERPYPCAPCGFSFKTKSNLYKHRKSHTHRVKAGLASGETKSLDEPITESEDETRHLTSAASMDRHGSIASHKGLDTDGPKETSEAMDDSYAVKKRLAMRLSRGKRGTLDSSDDKASALILGSRGSTESGYFSRSESTEQTQDSPPNTSAKSYAEIILGKYGRLGHLQRMSRHHNQQPSGQEEKNIPFIVPKKQVIDHITNLITINEAVVDTSKIDSVKPRRFSLSRKSSTETKKSSSVKEPIIQSPKARDPSYKNSGSITMGVPCEKFHHQSLTVEPAAGQMSTAPLLRSHSMPSAANSFDPSSGSPCRFRLSQSFDERQPSEMQASRRYGTLRRQPAIEIPLVAELSKEELQSSHSFYRDSLTTVPDHKQCQPQPYECESCGTGCKDWEGYKSHKQSQCLAQHPLASSEAAICQIDRPQLIHHPIRPGALAMRKRRKEESFEFDDPSSPGASSSPSPSFTPSVQNRDESSVAYEGSRRPTPKPFSVIQHTSSFEKQDTLCAENHGTEGAKINLPSHEDYQPAPQTQPQQPSTKPTPRKLVRQHNVQVPEIRVTADSTMNTESPSELSSATKQPEKPEEFQWPQRSPTLAQLPIEKLPPKKKRLRLAEAAQSSGESSFDSLSLPRSPSQDSSASYASSRSTSFEESNRPDMEIATSATPLRRSRAPHMLTVPGLHQHREMRRSASEQAPHEPQLGVIMAETRSKSFDYSCLSPERSAVGWRERRKCLLMRHSAVQDPDEEDEEQPPPKPSTSTNPVSPIASSRATPCAGNGSRSPTSPKAVDSMPCSTTRSPCREVFSRWKLSQNIILTGSTELPPIYNPSADHMKVAPPVHTGQAPGISLQSPQPYPTQGPSGAARAHYLPMSTGLKLEIPPTHGRDGYTGVQMSTSQTLHSLPIIIRSPDLLRPPTSLAIAVRLQADTPTPACVIYTTLCQTTPSRPQEPVCSISTIATIPTSAYRSPASGVSPIIQVWSEDGLRSSGSGGNKRMLSPSNSIELSPESQQQQKRVKEEEERREDGRVGEPSAETSKEEDKRERESRLCLPSMCSPVRPSEPSFPSLQSSTCNSWCYLNYIKPNPAAQDEHVPSVYSSWSTGGFDPNPPGLSSKMAMSLLHCKQRFTPSIYTMSPMSCSTTEDNRRPCCTEVYSSQPRDTGGHTRANEGQTSAEGNRLNEGEEEEEGKKDEEVEPCHEYKQPPQAWLSEGGSSEKYGYRHGGEAGGCERERGGFRGESRCVSPERALPQTGSRPCVCELCNADLKAKGAATTARLVPEDSQASDLVDRGGEEQDAGGEDSKDEAHTSSSHPLKPTDPTVLRIRQPERPGKPSRRHPVCGCQHQAGHVRPPTPGTLDGHAALRASPPCLSPARSTSPPRSPSSGPRLSPALRHRSSPSSLSPPHRHVSTAFPLRRLSPVRGLSPPLPVGRRSPVSGSTGSPVSPAGSSSAQYGACLPRDPTLPGDRPRSPAVSRLRTLSLDEGTHFCTHPAQPRGYSVLSHLPLHSQQPARAPSLMIPIGGIHMILPRAAPSTPWPEAP